MKRLPTDLQILNAIYERYYNDFEQHTDDEGTRCTKIYVPIDIKRISKDLGVDADIVFGRLYYHLERRHGYRQDDGSIVALFTPEVAEDVNCVHFPLMASVLADLRDQSKKHHVATGIAVVSLVISIVSITLSVLARSGTVSG